MSTSTTKSMISAPVMMVEETRSTTSTFASTLVPYYGSRAPKQSILETDRVLFQMINDIQISIPSELNEEKEWKIGQQVESPTTTTAKKNNILWKFRIVFSSILILLLVVATVVISELTKSRL